MAKGYILVQLFSISEAKPVTEAKIKITKAGTNELLYQDNNAVDINGKSRKYPLDAPSKELSLTPQNTKITPYSKYNLHVEADGYKDVNINGIEVFEEITSIQKINMIPVSKSRTVRPVNIDIPQNALLIDGAYNKQKGVSKEPFILKQVVIPQYIIVHLGLPTAYARDITVEFKEYIKNVASSEIYPTWPEEALRANIYCQITYALNRVYTEWYRNKGYSFQITNSTAYDQYFVEGRDIFENISRIVDDIFNEYVKIVGYKTPYFTQYCNGTTVTCAGLSQWGTVDLANKGYKAIDIIKYYYGNDKTIVTAPIVEGIPESYPGTVLKLGSTGEDVKIIQEQLNRISQNYPAIGKIEPVDGVFDKRTEDSVKTFQKVFNLTPDGIVGKATWYKISSIYVGVKKLAELDQEGEPEVIPDPGEDPCDDSGSIPVPPPTPDPKPEPPIISSPCGSYDGKYPGYYITHGSRGDKVKELQCYLNALSKEINIPSISVDGIFGNDTMEAVIQFQRLYGLDPDGIVGALTWNKIVEVYKNIYKTKALANDRQDKEYPGYIMKQNMKNEDIKVLQSFINDISKLYENIPEVKVDGVFDELTKRAVVAFQREFALSEDGLVGLNTWNRLIQVHDSLLSGKKINKSELIYDYPGEKLKFGDENGYVRLLQKYINVLSKNNYKVNPVETTGRYNKDTKNAVEKLQKILSLKVTGEVDEKTWNKIIKIYDELYSGKSNKNIKRKR